MNNNNNNPNNKKKINLMKITIKKQLKKFK